MKTRILGVVTLSLTVSVGCGGGGGTTDATGGAGDTGGATASGGSSTGSASSGGGTSGSGGSATGGASAGGYCSPVSLTQNGADLYPQPFDNCGAPSNWTGDSGASFRDFDLGSTPEFSPAQLGPGDQYAFAVNIGPGRFAVYGATEKCGDVGELLSDVTVTQNGAEGVVCHDIAPKTGTYTHLIWVWYGGGGHATTTFCINGTCPAK